MIFAIDDSFGIECAWIVWLINIVNLGIIILEMKGNVRNPNNVDSFNALFIMSLSLVWLNSQCVNFYYSKELICISDAKLSLLGSPPLTDSLFYPLPDWSGEIKRFMIQNIGMTKLQASLRVMVLLLKRY